MSSLWSSSLRLVVSQWRHNRANRRYWVLPNSRRISTFVSSPVSSSHDDNSSSPKKPHVFTRKKILKLVFLTLHVTFCLRFLLKFSFFFLVIMILSFMWLQLGYDPSEELFGLSADLQSRFSQILGVLFPFC